MKTTKSLSNLIPDIWVSIYVLESSRLSSWQKRYFPQQIDYTIFDVSHSDINAICNYINVTQDNSAAALLFERWAKNWKKATKCAVMQRRNSRVVYQKMITRIHKKYYSMYVKVNRLKGNIYKRKTPLYIFSKLKIYADNSVVNMHYSSYHTQAHSITVNKIHGTEQERREP